MRRALQASLKEAYQKKQVKPADPVISARSVCTNTKTFEKEQDKPTEPVATRSICTGTNTRFRIKSSVRKKLKNATKQCGDSPEKKKKGIEERESRTSQGTSPLLTKPLKRKDVAEITFSSVKKKKKESEKRDKEGFQKKSNEGSTKLKNQKGVGEITDRRKDDGKKMKKSFSESIARKELKSPGKTSQVTESSKGKELMILPKSKAAVFKLLNNRKIKGHQKSKVVQSLTEKFSATVRDGKQPATGFMKKDSEDQMDTDSSSEKIKKKTGLQKGEVEKLGQSSGPSNDSSSKTNKICELRQQVSNSLQGKVRRRLKHKFKNRRLVSPLGEIYIPANIAKTEDFLTFLCLRGKFVTGRESAPCNIYIFWHEHYHHQTDTTNNFTITTEKLTIFCCVMNLLPSKFVRTHHQYKVLTA